MQKIIEAIEKALRDKDLTIALKDMEIENLRKELDKTNEALNQANAIIDSMDGTTVRKEICHETV